MEKNNKNFQFNKAFQEIEEISQWFQSDNIDIDKGLEKYKRGLELIKMCQQKLKEVENQFIELKKQSSSANNEK